MANLSKFNNKRFRIEKRIEAFHEEAPKYLLPEQAKVISKFDRMNCVNDMSVLTRSNYISNLRLLARTVKKPFEKMTRKDLEVFLDEVNRRNKANSAQQIKIRIKRFFKFLYDTEEYPDVVKWVSTKKSKRHREPIKKILTLKERKAILNACKNQRDRALVAFMDNTGCRAEECLMTKTGDVVPDESGMFMTVTLGKGKTGRRRIVITEGMSDVNLWLNMHPLKHDPDAPVFISLSRHNRFQGLHPSGLHDIFEALGDNADLDRKLHPHLFRHTRATICGKVLKWNEARMRIFFGWVKGSKMPSVYTHMNDDDVNELILQEAGIVGKADLGETDIRDRECPRCHQKNPFDAKYCNICSLALDSKIAEKHSKITKVSDSIMDISQEKNLQVEKAVEKYVEEFRNRLMKDLGAGAFSTGN